MKPKVIVIVGPTASGKTMLSIEIATLCDGEVVSADSRQVYRGLDIGTGKVTPEEMNGIPHHLLDVADPMDVYTAADFARDGQAAINGILEQNHLPIIAGGTFFYVDALLGTVAVPEAPPNPALRASLEKRTAEALFAELQEKDAARAETIDPHNKVRLVRALELIDALGSVPTPTSEPLYDALFLGIEITEAQLHHNIYKRIIDRLDHGMIEEVVQLHANGMTYERMEELGLEYRYISRHLKGELTKEAMIDELNTKTRQFAKRQLTWLKRYTAVQWVAPDAVTEARALVHHHTQTHS